MKVKEPVQEYLSRVFELVSHMRTYGESLSNEIVVSKVLRSLTSEFDHVVAAIEESKDLSQYSLDELMGSLLAHEVRINRPSDKAEEKVFRMKGETNKIKQENSAVKNQGRGGYLGRGRGRGRGRGGGSFTGKSNIQCRYYKKFGHKEFECWIKQKNE